MAVDASEYIQNPNVANLKPSRLDNELAFWLADMRRTLTVVNVQGGLLVGRWVAPWAGVIESIRTTQLAAGGGAGGQNSLTLTVGGVNAFLAAADGNTVVDNDVAGTSALTAPTDGLTESLDGIDRFHFAKGDVIALGAVSAAGAYGTAQTEIVIARECPARV
jgi:hypothetical protein